MDARLGCLERNLPSDSAQISLIDAVSDIFITSAQLENGIPFWKLLPNASSNFRKFSKAYDIYTDVARKYIHESLERSNRLRVDMLTIYLSLYLHMLITSSSSFYEVKTI